MTEDKIVSGAIPDRIDTRDYKYSELGMSSTPFDWNVGYDIEEVLGHKIKPKDQNGSYSCGGQAISLYGQILEEYVNQDIGERSAKFSYSQCYQSGGGSSMRDLIALSKDKGFAFESLCPSYENGNPPSEDFMTRSQDITEEARKYAKSDTLLTYSTVNYDIDSFAQAIRDNQGMIIGVTGQNGKGWLTEFPTAPERSDWRHWIYAGKAKIINGKKYIGCLNSWGESVGNRGWQWIGEDYFVQGNLPIEYGSPLWGLWTITVTKNNCGIIRKLLLVLLDRLLKWLK